MSPESTAHLLDRCITALLAGRDWRACLPPDDDPAATEVVALMDIVLEIRRTRPGPPHRPRFG